MVDVVVDDGDSPDGASLAGQGVSRADGCRREETEAGGLSLHGAARAGVVSRPVTQWCVFAVRGTLARVRPYTVRTGGRRRRFFCRGAARRTRLARGGSERGKILARAGRHCISRPDGAEGVARAAWIRADVLHRCDGGARSVQRGGERVWRDFGVGVEVGECLQWIKSMSRGWRRVVKLQFRGRGVCARRGREAWKGGVEGRRVGERARRDLSVGVEVGECLKKTESTIEKKGRRVVTPVSSPPPPAHRCGTVLR